METKDFNVRGFKGLRFNDAYRQSCSIQESSVIPHLWLGIDDADPKVMAKDAHKVGVRTRETTGWVPYPIPKEVVLRTRMHLNRTQAEWLVKQLQNWLDE
jgi:hypothetical protein